MARVSISNETRARIPGASFRSIADQALPSVYELGLVFVTSERIRKLNLTYRNKDSATDILSFPISETQGEIYICPAEARKEAKKFDRKYGNFLLFLFIHGCVHLMGYDHGGTMESIEEKIRRKFKV